MAHNPSEILTLKEAAAFLQLCSRTVTYLAKTKKIPSLKAGNRFRFSRTALLAHVGGVKSV